MPLTADQAVTAILSYLAQHDYDELRAPKPAIHAAFARVQESLPAYFPEVSFGKYGSLMLSDEIDYTWRSHVMNGLISTDNPDLVVHRIKPEIADYYAASIAPDIEESLVAQTAEAARIFREALEEITSNSDVGALLVKRPA